MTETEFTTFLRNTEKITYKKEMDINIFTVKKKIFFNYVEAKDRSYRKILVSENEEITKFVASVTFSNNRLDYIHVDKKYRKTNLVDMLVFMLKANGINTASLTFQTKRNGRSFIRNYGFRCK